MQHHRAPNNSGGNSAALSTTSTPSQVHIIPVIITYETEISVHLLPIMVFKSSLIRSLMFTFKVQVHKKNATKAVEFILSYFIVRKKLLYKNLHYAKQKNVVYSTITFVAAIAELFFLIKTMMACRQFDKIMSNDRTM